MSIHSQGRLGIDGQSLTMVSTTWTFFGVYMMQNEILRAIDVVLDRGAVAGGKLEGVSIYADANGPIGEYVARVEKLLGRLENLPPEDPPKDLVSRTLAFVASGSDGSHAQPTLFDQPPLA